MNPKKFWTVSFFRRWLPYMSALSVLRYRNAVCRVPRNPIRDGRRTPGPGKRLSLRMKHPFEGVVFLRENTFDFITFEEVVFDQVYKAIPAHLPKCERVVDLGANIGLSCLYLAARYPTCKIVAVEPVPQNYTILTKNVACLIEAQRCLPMQAAVWGTDKPLVLEQPAIPERYNAYTVRQSAPTAKSALNVEGITIQRIMERAGFRELDILKVDVEGAETELFKGDLDWLNHTRAIAIEFHGNARAVSNFDRIIHQYGFVVQAEDVHTVLAVSARKNGFNNASSFPPRETQREVKCHLKAIP
jgi:FkbM family methyltransferase